MTGSAEHLRSALADRYTIERELGRGGNAVVYLAQDKKHDRKVALKVLLPELALAVRAERFLREIHIAAKLSHPHILPLLDSGETDGALYYVMPYVEGESLRDRLRREKQLPVDDSIRITREVAEALSYAHGQGVVHRDIKPENILLHAGQAVVADFGIARAITAASGQAVTETGLAVGTPAYMSPEQAGASGEADARSDIYSLGCVLYEMLAGHPPFTGGNVQEVLSRHSLDPVPSLKAARPDVSDGLEAVVSKALAKAPVARFATAAQFAQALTAPSAVVGSRRRALAYAGLGLLLLLGGSAVASRAFRRLPAAPPPEKSIAVLPFENLSTDTTQEYFSEGMTEELINALSGVEGLRVPGRTSSYAFKDKRLPLRTMADSLHVGTVLEGSVRISGTELRVSARLVNVADGYQIWSQTYDRQLKNAKVVFAIQDDITRAIVSALQVKLAAPVQVRPENLEAYQLYSKGRFFWNKGGEEGFNRAREFFTAAIAKDSGYARAYAGVADTYERLVINRYLPRAEAYPKARAAADRAVALDSQLAEGYTSRGVIRHRHEWDWSGAEADFRRAVALNPSYALGHLGYARFLVEQGRLAEGIREAGRAAELDPLSAQVLNNYSIVLYYAREYKAAGEQARKALQLEPTAEGHQYLAYSYLFQGEFANAIQEFQTSLDLLGGRGRIASNLARMGFAYARAGRRQEALDILRQMQALATNRDSLPNGYEYNVALLYGVLGEKDQAFVWLDRAYQVHEYSMTNLRVAPFFDPLRSDPRFKELLKKVGLGG